MCELGQKERVGVDEKLCIMICFSGLGFTHKSKLPFMVTIFGKSVLFCLDREFDQIVVVTE